MTVRRAATVAAVALASVTVTLLVVAFGVRAAQADEVRPNVSVAGVHVGGLDRDAAIAALRPVATARRADTVTATWRDRSFEADAERIDFHVDVEQTVDRALEVGRDGGLVAETVDAVQALWTDRRVDLVLTHDEQALGSWLDEVASEVDRDPTPGAVTADPGTLEVAATMPDDGAMVLRDETRDAVLGAFRRSGDVTIELPVEVTPARIDPADVEAVAGQARRALEEPLTLTASEESVTLSPRDLAPMIALGEVSTGDDEWTVELQVPVEAVERTFEDIAGRFEVAPVEAGFDAPRRPDVTFDAKGDVTWRPRPAEVTVVPGRNGATFDPALAAAQLSEVLAAGRRQVELRLAEVEPDLTTEEARALNVNELLSTFTTYHACCQARVANIQRLADMVDGTLVQPGEQFSINQISGVRSCNKGFVPAGMILNGEIVDSCGGGVSQFGTTTVNAVFFAGLKPDTYQPHSFYISRYPMGREATLNYPSPDIDVRFTNDTGNGILIRTAHTSTSITVSFYGSTDVAEVRAVHGQPTNTKPYPTERRVNNDLPPGAEQRVQSGRNGFSIDVRRVIVTEDGEEVRDDWSNRYVPETEIIEYNPNRPAPKPEPEPEPEPEPSPDPSPSPSEPGGGNGGGDDG